MTQQPPWRSLLLLSLVKFIVTNEAVPALIGGGEAWIIWRSNHLHKARGMTKTAEAASA